MTSIGENGGRRKGREGEKNHSNFPTNWPNSTFRASFLCFRFLISWIHLVLQTSPLGLRQDLKDFFFFQILEKKNMWEYQIQEIGQNKNKKQEGFCAARTGLARFQSSLDANHKQYMGNHYGNPHASWFCYGNPKEKAKEMSFFILWWEENLLSLSPEIDFLPWLSFYPENSEKEREPMTII